MGYKSDTYKFDVIILPICPPKTAKYFSYNKLYFNTLEEAKTVVWDGDSTEPFDYIGQFDISTMTLKLIWDYFD